MTIDVLEFRGKYRCLSNFAPVEVCGPGYKAYPSVEHAYQAAKTNVKALWKHFQSDPLGVGDPITHKASTYSDAQLQQIVADPVGTLNRYQLTAGEAKRLGKLVPVRSDWDITARLSVMHILLFEKFSTSKIYRTVLLSIDGKIEEGNNWRDTFWGVSPVGSGKGENRLGKLLMDVRDQLCADRRYTQDMGERFWK